MPPAEVVIDGERETEITNAGHVSTDDARPPARKKRRAADRGQGQRAARKLARTEPALINTIHGIQAQILKQPGGFDYQVPV